MITVGYGDITPVNNIEYMYSIITMIFGCGVFAYGVNEIGIIFRNISAEENEIKETTMIINNYMYKKNINSDLQFQVKEYLHYFLRESA